MGAEPRGLLDAVAGRDRSFIARVLTGLRSAAQAYRVPVLGGHTQFETPASLAVTVLGKAEAPVPGGGARPGQHLTASIDLEGQWRPGYYGRQWDSTSTRRTPELRSMLAAVGTAQPAAAKDISMGGVVGTLGMLAEASGCGALLDVDRVPRPAGASAGDWLTCFPGFGMLTADKPGAPPLPAAPATSAVCGEFVPEQGVHLRWPDGETTQVIPAGVTGWGRA
jgi:AIR synthase-related protein